MLQPTGTSVDRGNGGLHLRRGFGFVVVPLPSGQGTVLRVVGEIDVAAAPVLWATARRVLAERSGPVHLYLGEVTFLDCAGLDVLIELRGIARLAPSVVASRPVRRLMELAGVSDLFDLHPTPPDDR